MTFGEVANIKILYIGSRALKAFVASRNRFNAPIEFATIVIPDA